MYTQAESPSSVSSHFKFLIISCRLHFIILLDTKINLWNSGQKIIKWKSRISEEACFNLFLFFVGVNKFCALSLVCVCKLILKLFSTESFFFNVSKILHNTNCMRRKEAKSKNLNKKHISHLQDVCYASNIKARRRDENINSTREVSKIAFCYL